MLLDLRILFLLLGFHIIRMLGDVVLSSLFVWANLVSACCGYVDWIYPSIQDTDLTFNYIDVVYFTWVSSVDKPWMNLWCAPSPSESQSKEYGKSYAQCQPIFQTLAP